MPRIEDRIIRCIRLSIDDLIGQGAFKIKDLAPIYLQPPKDPSHGDLSTNVAMQIAHQSKVPSRKIAQLISSQLRSKLPRDPAVGAKVERIQIKDPGFINFFLSPRALYDVLIEIKEEGSNYGRSNIGRGKKVQIEFVSANPTGPLTIAHGRQAAVGGALSNILASQGYRVTREFYINDEGRQVDLLARSVRDRYLEKLGQPHEFPSDGYLGGYISDIAEEILARYGKRFAEMPEAKALLFFARYSARKIISRMRDDLKNFGINFDRWFPQSSLTRSGRIKRTLRQLEKKGFLYRKDGALWFRSTKFGDDKDRVLIKQDGSFTYIAPDIAYHRDKFRRGFGRVVNIWGPDHHGYIPRLEAAVQALGYPKESLAILIVQLVTLYKGREPVPMSTRMGEYVTLSQLTEEVGRDAGRFFFLMRKRDSHLDFDLELAKKETSENPVYYVQYAHARICSIIDFAKRRVTKKVDPSLLNRPEELQLLKELKRFPEAVQACARALEPHLLTLYLRQLATTFHSFYTEHRVVTEDKPLTDARLLLVDCTRQGLKNGLGLLGISAPEKM